MRKTKTLQAKLQQFKVDLGSAILNALYARSISTQAMVANVYPKLSETQKTIVKQISKKDKKMIEIIEQVESSLKSTIESTVDKSTKYLDTRLQDVDDSRRREQARDRLLRSLEFENIQQRRRYIQGRVGNYGKTFHWIFEKAQAHGFYEWLSTGKEIYWISGMPGSGKSSLVDYILQHLDDEGSAREQIKKWSYPEPVTVLSFFFYSVSSDPLQKTFEGLYRSLCYQMLVNNRVLCEKVLTDPSVPSRLRRLTSTEYDYGRHWLTEDLRELFKYLGTQSDCKLFILLDGLDEFGDRDRGETHLDLVAAIEEISSLPNVKLCCSSRPDAPFDAAFARSPQLKVQDLTRADIDSFVKERLGGTRAAHLIWAVVHGARGVFLWSVIVTEEICRGISDGLSREELDSLTTFAHGDMKALFAGMLKRANPLFVRSLKPYLQYIMLGMESDREPYLDEHEMHLSELLFTENNQEELSKCIQAGFSDLFVSKLNETAMALEEQVVRRCAGLVRPFRESRRAHSESSGDLCRTFFCSPNSSYLGLSALEQIQGINLDLIHKTAYDYLKDDPAGQEFLEASSIPEDTALLTLLRANVSRIILGLDHHFLGCSSRARMPGRLQRIQAFQQRLEAAPAFHTQYHQLTDYFFDKLVADFGYTPDSSLCNTSALLDAFPCYIWPANLPLGISVRLAYGCELGLSSYVAKTARILPLAQRRAATMLACCIAVINVGWGVTRRLRCVADLSQLCAHDPVTWETTCPGFSFTRYDYYGLQVEKEPMWLVVISLLLAARLNLYGRDASDFEAQALLVLRSLQSRGSPSTAFFELAMYMSSIYSRTFVLPRRTRLSYSHQGQFSQLTLHCTLENIICILLPDTGYPEWGLSGTGEPPKAIRWRPSGLGRDLELREKQESELWRHRDGHYSLNYKYTITLSEGQLTKEERTIVRKSHKEISQNCFRLFRY